LAIVGATVTTSKPVLDLSQTWNEGAGTVTFTGQKFNVTDTKSQSGSLLLDIGTGGGSYSSRFSVDKNGNAAFGKPSAFDTFIYLNGATKTFGLEAYSTGLGFFFSNPSNWDFAIDNGNLNLKSGSIVQWASSATTVYGVAADLVLRRAAAATLQLGAADAASPVPQTLQVQGVVAGTTNTAGANFTIAGSKGTGTGAGGSIIFQVAPAGTTGTAVNALATALTIDSTRLVTLGGNLTSSASNFVISSGATITLNNATNIGGALATSFPNVVIASNYAIGFSDGTVTGTVDARLIRDSAGVLALKNSTNPQIFRAYSTTTGPNYGYIAAGVTDAGVATSDTLFIGTGGAGAAMTKLALVVNGTTRADYNSTNASGWTLSGSLNTSSHITSGGNVYAGASSYFWTNSSRAGIWSPSSNNIALIDAGGSSFGRLMFGGSTSSFPSLKRSSADIQVRLADDSGYTTIDALLRSQGTAPATAASTGTAGDIRYDSGYIYVCTATDTWKRVAIATW
jgi:hypothetical protein